MVSRVAVLGAGSWGTTIAALLTPVVPTVLWARRTELADDLNAGRGNERYLPGFELPADLEATADLGEATSDAALVLVAVPTQGFRAVLEGSLATLGAAVPVVSLAKGFERGSCMRMSEVASEVLPGRPVAVLTGPNLAKEVLEGRSSAAVVAASDSTVSGVLQGLLASDRLRIYTNDDLVGCEIGGAVKNVIALAAGMAEGLDTGDNARAALMTRGLAEVMRYGALRGARAETLTGLSGLGDLTLTCNSLLSRNMSLGTELGKGRTMTEVLAERQSVAEGSLTAGAITDHIRALDIEMPICSAVDAILNQQANLDETIKALMQRPYRAEQG